MTLEPEQLKPDQSVDVKQYHISILEDLFYLGYANSDKIIIYKDPDKNIEINATFRTLTPAEHRDIFEYLENFNSMEAKIIAEKMEILARAVRTINDMPLVLDAGERKQYKDVYGHDPSSLEQARYIIVERIKSVQVIDALYEAYNEFVTEVRKSFEDVKKKLKHQKS